MSDTSNVHWMSQLLSLNYGDFKNVSLRVEKIQKDFLWGQEVLRKNTISQLVYNLQTQEKNEGLCFRNLSVLNFALLDK